MASKKVKGTKESKNAKKQTYAKVVQDSTSQMPTQSSSKSRSQVKSKKDDKPHSEPRTESAKQMEINANCDTDEQISFFYGNPFNEMVKGILHIVSEKDVEKLFRSEDYTHTVCMISIPATTTCQDILTFTAACHRDIQHFRILRNSNPNEYMMLIKFRSSASAKEFYNCFNETAYNSLEADVVCHLVFVTKVETADDGLPLVGLSEASCPVCLERMDGNVDSLLTILCNHTFHSSCLAKWRDTSCPICRYAQTPEPIADSHCMECASGCSSDALWICLICGHVGCSRYHEGHAFEHYRDTHHCYAMQLGTNRVWDYVGENFVHRLLQDKDGKMVESDREPTKGEITATDEKIDSVLLEFTHSLTTQLANQREYFEDKLNCYEQRKTAETAKLKAKLDETVQESAKVKEKVSQLAREKQIVEKKLHSSNTKLSQIQTELIEEKALRKALNSNQTSWEIRYQKLQDERNKYKNTKESEHVDLKEQVRDLMFFIEAQQKIQQSTEKEDIASGHIVIPEAPKASTSHHHKKHSKDKR